MLSVAECEFVGGGFRLAERGSHRARPQRVTVLVVDDLAKYSSQTLRVRPGRLDGREFVSTARVEFLTA